MPPRPASIVLVEDSQPYAMLVTMLLEGALPGGAEVRHHERLADALEDLRHQGADCILLDLTLPDARELEGLAAFGHAGIRTPIVVLSGHDDDELAAAAIAAGAQDYLVKGQERESRQFVRTIRFAIERQRAKERSEDLLRAREDRWRTLTQMAPVGILETDPSGRCVFANDWMADLTGRDVAALLHDGWRGAVHPEDLPRIEAAVRAAREGAGVVSMEVRFVRAPDDEIMWAQATVVLLRDPLDGPAGWLVALVDVTEAHRARDDLGAVARLARDASVTEDDPVPLLLRGGRTLLGAEALELVATATSGAGLLEPVRRGDAQLGFLEVTWRDGHKADEREITIARLLAGEVGAALERRRLLDELRDLARTDPLTGIANRRLWDERLTIELARAGRYERPLCVALLDLDHFKAYNDRHGHHEGDELLRAMTEAWGGVVRGADLLARLGGDEFGLLLPDCDLDSARSIVARLVELTDDAIGCSAGLVLWQPPTESAQALLARADSALYAAKEAGRDGIVVG